MSEHSTQILPPLDDDLDEDELSETIEAKASGSVLDLIRERRDTFSAEHEYDMLVPGYGGLLALRCTPLHGSMLTTLRMRIERSRNPSRDYELAADILVNVCDQVLARRTKLAPWEGLDPNGEPVALDARLGELLGIQAKSARELVRAVFDKAPSPEIAVGDAVGDYLAWAQGADADIDDELLGES